MQVSGWRGATDPITEETNQIYLARQQPDASGELLWHSRTLMRGTNGVVEVLEHQVYAKPALVPALSWMKKSAPAKPSLKASSSGGALQLDWRSRRPVWQWVLQTKAGGEWSTQILPGDKTSQTIQAGAAGALPEEVALFAVDRYGNMSASANYPAR
jgi:hypothetical protein